mgnify:CR=1 FL=1
MGEIILQIIKLVLGLGVLFCVIFLVYGLIKYFLSRSEKYFRMFVLSLVSLFIISAVYAILITCSDCNGFTGVSSSNAIIK